MLINVLRWTIEMWQEDKLDLQISVPQTLALLDETNWTYLKKKSFICCKKELNVYKQTLGFGRLFSFLILSISPITIQPNHST